ncbi:hypothetical protein [Streptomyces sp. NPDC002328]|uniref:hypothetical protein n=1 Tax=Streptomyces sp. NPDC002328 TaxID=3364642 RepID=UPI0036ADA809
MHEGGAAAALGAVVTALGVRLGSSHPARDALRSTAEAVDNAEPELALDDLCRVIRFFGVPVTPEEYDALRAVAEELSMADVLEEADLGPPDPAGGSG